MSEHAFLRTIRSGTTIRWTLSAAAVLVCLPLLSGCGGGGDILATVGDRQVTAAYYQDRLSKLEEIELPVGEDGAMLDPASLESKLAFLEVIINKELMVLKARELGYHNQEEMLNAEQVLTRVKAAEFMRGDLITVDPSEIPPADVDEYYAKRQERRHFQFIICNFEDDCLEARQKIIDGAAWEEVAEEYNDGSKGPTGDYRMSLQYGMADDSFERAIFELEEGQISMPIETIYGYWIVKFTGTEPARERPLDDTYRERIRQTLAGQRTTLSEKAFIDASLERHEYEMNEAALWSIFQGLPEDEGYLDPETNQPIPKAELAPLDVPAEESDKVFFSVRLDPDEEPTVWTVGRFKATYNEMSVFQRPKRSKMLGGVRNQIIYDMVVKPLLDAEARERGYYDDPRVAEEVQDKLEEIMVDRFYEEVIKYEEFVSAEDLAEYWAEHSADYVTPETRDGLIVICEDQEQAAGAREALQGGVSWEEVYETYAAVKDPVNRGAFSASAAVMTPDAQQLFGLAEVDDVSEPFENRSGWCVVRLANIVPPVQRELDEVREEVGQRIRLRRKDEALKQNLADWREEFGVQIHEDALAAMPSWNELQAAR
jgi:parvulin-like peptidyl-prolyl isomerase